MKSAIRLTVLSLCLLVATGIGSEDSREAKWIEGCKTDYETSSAANSCRNEKFSIDGTWKNVTGRTMPYCKVKAECKFAWREGDTKAHYNWEVSYTGTNLDMTKLVNCDGYLQLNNC